MTMHPYEIRNRYLGLKKPEGVQSNDAIEKQFLRRTIRYFDPNKKISREQLEYLINAAQCAPNSSGAASWSVIALTTDEEKQRFLDTCGRALDVTDPINLVAVRSCSAFLIWVADNNKIEQCIRAVANKEISDDILKIIPNRLPNRAPGLRALDLNSTPMFDADKHVNYLNQGYYTMRAMMDATIAAQTFVVCAESLDIGTMYIGSIAHCRIQSFVETLGMPQKTYPIFGLCVGYKHPDGTDQNGCRASKNVIDSLDRYPNTRVKPIAPIQTVLHWGRYDQQSMMQQIYVYNQILWEYSSKISRRPTDYMAARATCRVQQADDQVKMMEQMGMKFGPTIP